MPTLPIILDEDLNAALEAVALRQRRDKAEVVIEALRLYVDSKRQILPLRALERAALYRQAEATLAECAADMEKADEDAPA